MAKTKADAKPSMHITLAIVSLALAFVFLGFVILYSQQQRLSYVTISASGTASAAANEALVYISLNGTGNTTASATANLSRTLQEFNTTILPLINRNLTLIQTTYYGVNRPYQTGCYPVPVGTGTASPDYCIQSNVIGFNGYVATEDITVTLPNSNNVSAAINALSKIPDLTFQSIQATLSDTETATLNRQALSLAIANATAQARILAGNDTQLKIENITVQNQYIYPYLYAVGSSSAGTNSSSTFYPGQLKISKSVTVVFSKS